MGSAPTVATPGFVLPPAGQQQVIDNLIKLQRAAKKINSILDVEALIASIVNDVVCSFGCIHANIFLHDESREEMIAACVDGCCCTIYGKEHALKIGRDGMVGHVAFTGKMHYAPDVSRDPFYLPCEEKARSSVAIPLKVGERLIGVFSANHPEVDGFSKEQLQCLQALADHVAIALDNAQRFQHERERNERFSKEALEAQQIQRQLLPKSSLLLSGFSASGATLPAGAVGGDWYDYIELPGGKWGFVLADVSGKGMAAALLMSATRGVFRAIAEDAESPGEVLRRINGFLLRDFPAGRFVTMIYGVLDPAQRTFTFANAGHPWPVVLNGTCAQLVETQTGLPLGIADAAYSESTVALNDGGRVLLYSDGISEAVNDQQQDYGTARLAELVKREYVSTEMILDHVRAFSNGQPAFDDATVVLISART